MYDWDDLRYFLAAYRAGSIGRASELLGVSQSTVSRRLAVLEDALGTPMFVRSPEGLIPTPPARAMLAAAEAAEDAAEQVRLHVQELTEAPTGTVRISMPGDMTRLILTSVFAQLRRTYPQLILEIVEGHDVADLTRMEADVAVRLVRPTSGDLVITRLREVRLALFASRSLIEEFGDDPLRLPWLGWVTELSHLPESAWFEQAIGPQVRVVSRVNDFTTMRLLAASGMGAACLPRLFGRLTPNLVELVPPVQMPPPRPLWLACNASVRQTPQISAVWSFLEDQLRARPSEVEDELLRERLARTQGIHFDRT